MDILVGYTGFVGQNLHASNMFDHVFNSQNILEAHGLTPDLCVYAGVRAEKFRADKNPEEDREHVENALYNIKEINPKKLVLISTVDVIPSPQNNAIHEDIQYECAGLTPYGKNRLHLEDEVRKAFPTTLIIRLPGLWGKGIKKNFIFDIMHPIPSMLKCEKFNELSQTEPKLIPFYKKDVDEFFRLSSDISANDMRHLKSIFEKIGFSSLNFTDSRSRFAFYNLKCLWVHITLLLKANITLAHMACEPISANEIYEAVFKRPFHNEVMDQPFDYSFFKTNHTPVLGGKGGYIFSKLQVLEEITSFIKDGSGHGG